MLYKTTSWISLEITLYSGYRCRSTRCQCNQVILNICFAWSAGGISYIIKCGIINAPKFFQLEVKMLNFFSWCWVGLRSLASNMQLEKKCSKNCTWLIWRHAVKPLQCVFHYLDRQCAISIHIPNKARVNLTKKSPFSCGYLWKWRWVFLETFFFGVFLKLSSENGHSSM